MARTKKRAIKETTFSSAELAERAIYRRAVEAAIWGMPAVNYDLMYQAFVKINGGSNQIAYWSRPLDWKNQTLTRQPKTRGPRTRSDGDLLN